MQLLLLKEDRCATIEEPISFSRTLFLLGVNSQLFPASRTRNFWRGSVFLAVMKGTIVVLVKVGAKDMPTDIILIYSNYVTEPAVTWGTTRIDLGVEAKCTYRREMKNHFVVRLKKTSLVVY